MKIKADKGDKIKAYGYCFEIGKILFQDINLGGNPTADIEFMDNVNRYHHWQSWHEQGELIMKDGTVYKFENEI